MPERRGASVKGWIPKSGNFVLLKGFLQSKNIIIFCHEKGHPGPNVSFFSTFFSLTTSWTSDPEGLFKTGLDMDLHKKNNEFVRSFFLNKFGG